MTYSIVARDPATGQLGVAVQSHYLGVGPVVPWLEPGVGAIATQARVDIAFGPIGLELLRNGRGAEQVVAALLASDATPEVRQVGVVDTLGQAAAYTGTETIPAAGHLVGDGFTVQGNLLERDTCWPAMARAYEAGLAKTCPSRTSATGTRGGRGRGWRRPGRRAGDVIVDGSPPNTAGHPRCPG
jgi:uncharacterized Ntn-hydrolase superfamily protein